ncbi:MAG: HAD hydrolase-like protein [Mesotoga sp.]|uniref:HAD family hydrolase n=1 Tax=unclassified Mesotoga TaxID=1184398 RepID=UPI000EF1AD57|nr:MULTISPECIES: HAD family hydrolase [unclassified Mesotoga]MDI9367845.1 HAD hydrolase-like protein [Thermotogota bacterium]NLT46758.1 HAD hydrolase-like protein [Thermotogaceae bacterium]MDD2332906.1 HAD hydrolase-like protein [Mesotoga sp.]MDD3680377.1 HAD hydrolase-like protein [Mesotoga sp.]MDD4206519.1 HAD hydrolase-like protein [Mesotoga sp.]
MKERITYLFDLDGTLSAVSDEDFARRYFQLVFSSAEGRVVLEKLMSALEVSLKALFGDRDNFKNNYDLFMERFVESMGDHDQNWYEQFFNEFYDGDYNKLEELVAPRENVVKVLKDLRKAGKGIIIATNPIFPGKAINKRLEWVGVEKKFLDYVTTMENSHYVKPDLRYYREILEVNGLEASNCVMIGNDMSMDGVCSDVGIEYIDVSSIQSIWKTT